MKSTRMLTILVLALGLMVCLAQVSKAAPMGTAFTYQGRLIDANSAANGLYDFQFKLFDDPCTGSLIAGPVNEPNLDVIDGYFTAALDFGANVFAGDARWLEIDVRPGDPCEYTILSPRQEITPTPYAIYADSSNWNNLIDIPADIADGDDDTQLTEVQVDGYVANNGYLDGSSALDWDNITIDMPAGFADGIDNIGGFGDITAVNAGTGLSGGGTSGSVTLSFSTSWGDSQYLTLNSRQTLGGLGTKTFVSQQKFNGGLTAYVGNENSIIAQNTSAGLPTIVAVSYGGSYAGYFQGDLGCTGSKPATVTTQSYGNRNLYSDESAEIYFFDRGRGQLTNGTCVINLDPMFLETVTINDSYPMLVQITLTADCKGVFVAEKTNSSFTVQELQGGASNATFDWEVAAKRKGYEDTRMEKITFVEDPPVEIAGTGTESGEEGIAPPTRGVRIIRGE